MIERSASVFFDLKQRIGQGYSNVCESCVDYDGFCWFPMVLIHSQLHGNCAGFVLRRVNR